MSTQENHNVEEEMAKQEETVTENAEQQAAAEAAEEQQEVADPVMQELEAAGIYEGCQTAGAGYPDSKNTGCF